MKHKMFEIDISEWEIDALNDIENKIYSAMRKAVVEVLTCAFESDETYISFPVEWSEINDDGLGGPPVKDPLTVYLSVGLDCGYNKPTYEFNLRDALSRSIKACAVDGSFTIGLGKLSVALRELANEIDTAIEKPKLSVSEYRDYVESNLAQVCR